MTDKPTSKPASEAPEYRCLELVGDAMIAAGTVLAGPAAVLTDHLLTRSESQESPPKIELPPGVDADK